MFLMFHNAPPSEVADKMLHGMLDSASDIRPLRWCLWLTLGFILPEFWQGSAILLLRAGQGFRGWSLGKRDAPTSGPAMQDAGFTFMASVSRCESHCSIRV